MGEHHALRLARRAGSGDHQRITGKDRYAPGALMRTRSVDNHRWGQRVKESLARRWGQALINGKYGIAVSPCLSQVIDKLRSTG